MHVVARREQQRHDDRVVRCPEPVEHGCHVGLLHVDERVLDRHARRRPAHRRDQRRDRRAPCGVGRAVRRRDERGRAGHPSSSTSIMPPTIRVRYVRSASEPSVKHSPVPRS